MKKRESKKKLGAPLGAGGATQFAGMRVYRGDFDELRARVKASGLSFADYFRQKVLKISANK